MFKIDALELDLYKTPKLIKNMKKYDILV